MKDAQKLRFDRNNSVVVVHPFVSVRHASRSIFKDHLLFGIQDNIEEVGSSGVHLVDV